MYDISEGALQSLKESIENRATEQHYWDNDEQYRQNWETVDALNDYYKTKNGHSISDNLTDDWGINYCLDFERKLLEEIGHYLQDKRMV